MLGVIPAVNSYNFFVNFGMFIDNYHVNNVHSLHLENYPDLRFILSISEFPPILSIFHLRSPITKNIHIYRYSWYNANRLITIDARLTNNCRMQKTGTVALL